MHRTADHFSSVTLATATTKHFFAAALVTSSESLPVDVESTFGAGGSSLALAHQRRPSLSVARTPPSKPHHRNPQLLHMALRSQALLLQRRSMK